MINGDVVKINGESTVRQLVENIDIEIPDDGCVFDVYDNCGNFCVGGMITDDYYWGSEVGNGNGGMDSLVNYCTTFSDSRTHYVIFDLV
jgi:hypothetical protein